MRLPPSHHSLSVCPVGLCLFRLFRLLLCSFPWARSPFRTGVQGRVAGDPPPTVAATGRALICSRSSGSPVDDVPTCRGASHGRDLSIHSPAPNTAPPARGAWTSRPVLWYRGAGRREELNHTHSPAPTPAPWSRPDADVLGRNPCCDAVARVVARNGFLLALRPRTPAPWPASSAQDRSQAARQWTSRTPTTCAAAPRRGARGQP